jgi:hypothetical protein
MNRTHCKRSAAWLLAGLLLQGMAFAEFVDSFDGSDLAQDPAAVTGWAFFTGDGAAVMDFAGGEGFASIHVDATADRRNVWWALIRRQVSQDLDLNQLARPGYELRIEARVRLSHAPRRVNLHLNTQRTTDFHSHLMEFDIADADRWHTISMTTRDFDARPGDAVFGQMALMDWGLDKYRADVDYFKVSVVEAAAAGPDLGEPVLYHPLVPDIKTYKHTVSAAADCMIDSEYPQINFNNWHTQEADGKTVLLTTGGSQVVILRWDLGAFAGKKIPDYGLLELTTFGVQQGPEQKDFGLIRVVEILGGDADWRQETVTWDNFFAAQPMDQVLNPQMIIDVKVSEEKGGKILIPISRPVLQRLIDGRTKGLALRPLGAIAASFYAMENSQSTQGPRLYFNTEE